MRRASIAAVVALLAAGGAAGGWYWWNATEKDRIIEEKNRVIKGLEEKLDRVWATELVADVRVDKLVVNPVSLVPEMTITFIEYEPGTEKALLTKTMTLLGEEFYIDALVVTFDRALVEEGNGLKGKSLLLFRRAFGDRMEPAQGIPLFRAAGESVVPELLQVDPTPGEFEREIWTHFWDYANDPTKAGAAGVRVAMGEAPHVKAMVGQVYKLTLRASGGLEIVPRLPAAVLGGAGAPGSGAPASAAPGSAAPGSAAPKSATGAPHAP
jgi:hypothetical protein